VLVSISMSQCPICKTEKPKNQIFCARCVLDCTGSMQGERSELTELEQIRKLGEEGTKLINEG
jgi:hypothetical protein